ncbi:MAG: Cell division protein FtsL [Luteibacter sp.]|uniref:cell division protein FtsL n=1 Tax=Luteibacter sp. TaxID=1886636 RepID=UPI0013826FAC|nr:cell division protein FtsL [Luteibacter sp.]KAF1005958.1 MAG: Cell division protein FtsL [Luteibacter sp.]
MSSSLKTAARCVALVALAALLVVDVGSAIDVIWHRQQARTLSIQLYKLAAERDALQSEYGRLLLEQATYADPQVVEERATRDLGMVPQPVLRLIRGQRTTPNWPLMIERTRQVPTPTLTEDSPGHASSVYAP